MNLSLRRPAAALALMVSCACAWALPPVAGSGGWRAVRADLPGDCKPVNSYARAVARVAMREYTVTDLYDAHIKEYAQDAGLDWRVFKAVLVAASGMNPQYFGPNAGHGLAGLPMGAIYAGMDAMGFPGMDKMPAGRLEEMYRSDPELQVRAAAHYFGLVRSKYGARDDVEAVVAFFESGPHLVRQVTRDGRSMLQHLMGAYGGPPGVETASRTAIAAGVAKALGAQGGIVQAAACPKG